MKRPEFSIVLSLAVCLLATSAAHAQDQPPAGGVTVLVHVADGSRGGHAGEGLDVELVLMRHANRHDRLAARTNAEGVAHIAVPPEIVAEGPVRTIAGAEHAGLAFFSEPFLVTGRQPALDVAVVVYDPMPRMSLPHWSYAALAAIFVLAVGLVVVRRSDRRLPDQVPYDN